VGVEGAIGRPIENKKGKKVRAEAYVREETAFAFVLGKAHAIGGKE